MSIFTTIKNVAVALLDPKRYDERGELAYLREVYYNQQGNVRPRQWYRLYSESGSCVGFSYICSCSTEYQLLSAFEWLRNYKCSACKDEFELLKFAGITKDTPASKWESFLVKLPIRPRLAGKQQPRCLDTWAQSGDGEARYEQANVPTI